LLNDVSKHRDVRKAEGSQEKYESLKSERIWNKDMPSLIKKNWKSESRTR